MRKIKDNIDLKELKKYGYDYWDNENAEVNYFKKFELGYITILKNRMIDIQLPIGSPIPKNYIKLENLINDLIKGGLVEEVGNND